MDFLVAVCAGAVTLIALIFGTPLAAQTPAKRANSAVVKSIPRAADGHPNLEGNWSTAVLTPLERPAEFAGKLTISEEEAAAYDKKLLNELDEDRPDGGAAGRFVESKYRAATKQQIGVTKSDHGCLAREGLFGETLDA